MGVPGIIRKFPDDHPRNAPGRYGHFPAFVQVLSTNLSHCSLVNPGEQKVPPTPTGYLHDPVSAAAAALAFSRSVVSVLMTSASLVILFSMQSLLFLIEELGKSYRSKKGSTNRDFPDDHPRNAPERVTPQKHPHLPPACQ